MTMKHRTSSALVALACSLATGCSFFATHGPLPPPQPPSCSVSSGPPVLDALVATVAVFTSLGFGIGSAVADTEDEERSRATAAGVLALTSVVTLTSAVVGAVRVRSCKKATAAYDAAQRSSYPPGYLPPPPGPR